MISYLAAAAPFFLKAAAALMAVMALPAVVAIVGTASPGGGPRLGLSMSLSSRKSICPTWDRWRHRDRWRPGVQGWVESLGLGLRVKLRLSMSRV